jgi:hypothetical protein
LCPASATSASECASKPNTTSTTTNVALSVTPTANAVPKLAGACEWP